MELPSPSDVQVPTLGACTVPSPLPMAEDGFIDEGDRVLLFSSTRPLQPFLQSGREPPAFEMAGPRRKIFFYPKKLTCGIVTCGGLCPGLNDVIRSIVLTLRHGYGVQRILGFRYGYLGLTGKSSDPPLELTLELMSTIHERGGTLLGSSRGPQDISEMVDTLVRQNVGILFTIGGDGTLRGASAICQEITRRQLSIAVIGVPKTIDNDLDWTMRSFGFTTAVSEARESISAAHTEAVGAYNGIGLVKLMGRHSGFISAHASLASGDVNFCLVPEVPFSLHGEKGFLAALERRLGQRRHAVVVVAEGAGQDILQDPAHQEQDASGNLRLKDVGVFLRDQIGLHFRERGIETTVKYIDPSYTIRSLPAGALDSEFCLMLGQHAAHAGMAGKTDLVVGLWNQNFTYIPISLSVARTKKIDPRSDLWQRVLETTGQPASMPG